MNGEITNQRDYLAAAKGWETNEISNLKRSRTLAWVVAGVGAAIAVISVSAVAMLTPLKTVEPFVVKVDKNTGQSDVVTLLDQKTITYNEAIDKYFIGRYVNYREEYSNAEAFPNYQAVTAMSTQDIARVYFNSINPSNKQSPVMVYGKQGEVEVKVNSVVFMGNNVAQVRFLRQARMSGGSPWDASNWIATITYEYTDPPTAEKDRLVNPVGFRVLNYRLDPENLPSETPPEPGSVPLPSAPSAPVSPDANAGSPLAATIPPPAPQEATP